MWKINWELYGAITAMFVCLYMPFTVPQQRQVVYNCSIAEISPDIPVKVKEQCRNLAKQHTIAK